MEPHERGVRSERSRGGGETCHMDLQSESARVCMLLPTQKSQPHESAHTHGLRASLHNAHNLSTFDKPTTKRLSNRDTRHPYRTPKNRAQSPHAYTHNCDLIAHRVTQAPRCPESGQPRLLAGLQPSLSYAEP